MKTTYFTIGIGNPWCSALLHPILQMQQSLQITVMVHERSSASIKSLLKSQIKESKSFCEQNLYQWKG